MHLALIALHPCCGGISAQVTTHDSCSEETGMCALLLSIGTYGQRRAGRAKPEQKIIMGSRGHLMWGQRLCRQSSFAIFVKTSGKQKMGTTHCWMRPHHNTTLMSSVQRRCWPSGAVCVQAAGSHRTNTSGLVMAL